MINNIEKTMYELMGKSDQYEKMIQERKKKQREEVIKAFTDPTKALCLLKFPIENMECLFKGKTNEEISERWKSIHEAMNILITREVEEKEQAEAQSICKLFNMTKEEEPFDRIVQKNPTKFYADKGRQISFFDLLNDEDYEDDEDDDDNGPEVGRIICIFGGRSRC